MKYRYLIVSIDTEEDMPEWRVERNVTTTNIQNLPILQSCFHKHCVKPTYLVTKPVLESHESLSIIHQLKGQGCEIGAHLHSWNTPPITDQEKKRTATYLSNNTYEVKKAKLTSFTQVFFDKIGVYPTSYRAGRYGVCRESASILAELKYKIDSSVAPMMDFSNDGGPDFKKIGAVPFYIDGENGNNILEIPITIALVHRLPVKFETIYRKIPNWTKIKGLLYRTRIARLLWLRPTTYSILEMKQLADFILYRLNIPVLNIMFHSSEVCPGTSPYNKTQADVDKFLKRLDGILSYLVNDRNIQSITMTQFAEKCQIDNGLSIFGEKLPVKML